MSRPIVKHTGLFAGLLMLPIVVLPVADCASPYQKWEDQSDACYAARAPLLKMGNDFERTVLGATAVGAGGGALAGLLIGRSAQDVLIGAVSGALVGALAGYLDAKYEQARTQTQVLTLIDQDASHDTAVVSQTTNAISGLIACRDGQIRTIEADYASQRITRVQALEQYRNVQAQMQEDDKLIRTLLGAADQREQKYIGARSKVLALPQAPASSPATEQLSAARQQAADAEARYQRKLGSLDDIIEFHKRGIG